jgi:hypothetical protein
MFHDVFIINELHYILYMSLRLNILLRLNIISMSFEYNASKINFFSGCKISLMNPPNNSTNRKVA